MHNHWIMEALILVTTVMVSGALALGGTRAVLGLVLMAIVRDTPSR